MINAATIISPKTTMNPAPHASVMTAAIIAIVNNIVVNMLNVIIRFPPIILFHNINSFSREYEKQKKKSL